jgi:hypothetical protein
MLEMQWLGCKQTSPPISISADSEDHQRLLHLFFWSVLFNQYDFLSWNLSWATERTSEFLPNFGQQQYISYFFFCLRNNAVVFRITVFNAICYVTLGAGGPTHTQIPYICDNRTTLGEPDNWVPRFEHLAVQLHWHESPNLHALRNLIQSYFTTVPSVG